MNRSVGVFNAEAADFKDETKLRSARYPTGKRDLLSGSIDKMTLQQALAALEAKGSERLRALNAKNGVGDDQFGVQMGEIRAVAKQIKSDHELGLELWRTGNYESMLLATLVLKPKQLTIEQLEAMLSEMPVSPQFMMSWLADWTMTNVVKPHPQKEEMRQRWMKSSAPQLSRAGWSLSAERVAKNPEGLDIAALLDRIEAEMPGAPPFVQWTMNFTLAQVGIEFPDYRPRALAIGEKLGVFKDYPVSKGCTSPYAPIWINEMAARKEAAAT